MVRVGGVYILDDAVYACRCGRFMTDDCGPYCWTRMSWSDNIEVNNSRGRVVFINDTTQSGIIITTLDDGLDWMVVYMYLNVAKQFVEVC